MKTTPYKGRIADALLKKKLKSAGAILIEGPKWCGKTTTAEQAAKSVLYLDDPAQLKQNLQMAETDPSLLLTGKNPRLIDEWQLAPPLWDAARFVVDRSRAFGRFIFTGSSVPADMSSVKHSGAGRFAWIKMRTMSLFESGESNGTVSLGALFKHVENISGENPLDLKKIAYAICRGGWPRSVALRNKTAALEHVFDYFDAVVSSDISRVDNVRRDAEHARRLMRSYARHQGGQVSVGKIRADMAANDAERLSEDSVASYISALKKIFVIEDALAWNPNLRSKTAIRTTDTRYFVDPAIAAAALGIGPADLLSDLETMGLLFETLCVRDLRVYADALGGNVYHYRDKSDLECDAVLHRRDGSYGLIEIKLGGDSLINAAAKNLLALSARIDTTRMKAPSFLMILTGTGKFAYRRSDGIYIVPVGCLTF